MARGAQLILDRYEPLGIAGEGGFGTVQIAWDPRIQRKVAIKTIKLTELDAYRANLPGARAVSSAQSISTADRWHGAQPWDEYLRSQDALEFGPDDRDEPYGYGEWRSGFGGDDFEGDGYGYDEPRRGYDGGYRYGNPGYGDSRHGYGKPDADALQVTSLSHLPGLDEARTAAMLSDPRIVTVYDFEVRGRTAYLIMEYVEGITLTRLLADYGDFLTLDMVTAVFDAMAGALTVAHGAGVLHLDIKPDNIIVNAQGQAKVTDFGLATLADASGAGTTGGGTVGYMPLEQMRREHLDARTDEWSLAAVTYEMLTGDNPFRVGNLEQAEAAIEDAELVLPSLCWENLDEQVDDVLFYGLDPDRDERYATVADFAEEMDKFLGDAAKGKEQLSLVVADALGLNGDGDEVDEEAEADGDGADCGQGLFQRVLGMIGLGAAGRDDGGGADFEDDEPTYGRQAREAVRRSAEPIDVPHEPLAQRLGERASNALGRAFAAAGSGFLTWFALANVPGIPTAFGVGSTFVAAVIACVVAAIAAIVPHVGALVSMVLLGLVIVFCGHPLVGVVLIAATVLWWYLVGRQGMAPSNATLALPLLGAVGGASAVPLLAGAALRVPAAVATTVLVAVQALVLASLGSGTLAGWDAFAHWDFMRADVTGNLIALLGRPSTWATIAGWIVGATVLSALSAGGKRWSVVVGVAAALCAVLAGSLIFAAPTPQLIVAPVLAAVACLVVLA